MNAPLEHFTTLVRASGDAESSGDAAAAKDQVAEIPAVDGPVAEAAAAENVLQALQQELNRAQRAMRLLLQDRLQGLVGRSLGSLEHNRVMAAAIQTMLDQHGFRVRCHQCGHPAILRVSPRKGVADGAFVFDHTVEGRRTFHGGSACVPPIHLLAKPERKSRQ